MGKLFIGLGITFCLIGLVLMFGGRVPLLGRLPGNFVLRRGGFSCFFPLGTSIALSILLSLLITLLAAVLGRLR